MENAPGSMAVMKLFRLFSTPTSTLASEGMIDYLQLKVCDIFRVQIGLK
jgi:hypothetical protein